MPGPVFAQVFRGLAEADAAAAMSLDPVQDLLDAWPFGQPPQLSGQELLQRLPAALGPALQGSMDVIWKVTYEHVRHAFIMQALVALCKLAEPSDCLGR
jgi:hypothetical protein